MSCCAALIVLPIALALIWAGVSFWRIEREEDRRLREWRDSQQMRWTWFMAEIARIHHRGGGQ